MADKKQEERWQRADENVRKNLPPGVKLVRTLRGHTNRIGRIAWSPDGRLLASPSDDGTIRLWDTETGERLRTLLEHGARAYSVTFDPTGRTLASGSADMMVRVWEVATGTLLRTLEGHEDRVYGVAFDPVGLTLASCGPGGTVKLWKARTGKCIRTMGGQNDMPINAVAYDRRGSVLISGSDDGTVRAWSVENGQQLGVCKHHEADVTDVAFHPNAETVASTSWDRTINLIKMPAGRLLRRLEGHVGRLNCVAFSHDGRLLASKGDGSDNSIRIWNNDTGVCLAKISMPASPSWFPGLAFHPRLPILASVGTDPGRREDDIVIHLWELDLAVFRQLTAPAVTYTSAKVVLVGDSGVGKTGLGWRLAHGEFKEHASTHGQQFWLLKQLCKLRRDGTQCEAVLWDLAGQPDYRLIHSLFLDDADLALVLFDPTRDDDPLSGVEFWLRQLKVGSSGKTPTLLVAARSDRGTPRLTQEELERFCKQRGIVAYLPTSAKADEGIAELLERMQDLIPWDDKPATVTTETFKRIKDFVLNLKENRRCRKVVLTPEELRKRLEEVDRKWKFSDAEMLTAAGHLGNHGYVTRLVTSQGGPRILLAPELLNNLAASFVLEARRNQKGLGSLEEQKLLSGAYKFPELQKLSDTERAILLDSAAVLFLEHNVCFRETDPLHGRAYLVFPELMNLKRPAEDDAKPVEDGVAYSVSGAVENVYASLVVLMGYTQTFTRTNQWRNHARYEVGNGQVCGFRLEEERAGELDFVLYFGADTDGPVRMLFQSLFENFLARRNLTVRRFEPAACKNGHALNRAVVRQRISGGANFSFCSECGEKITLPKADQPIQLTRPQAEEVEANRRVADQRSRFEQVLFRLKTYVTEQKIAAPECFISYAWGKPEHERWVEKSLATDLQKAGVGVVLDRWHNPPGSSIGRFVDRLEKIDRIVVVGTTAYRRKYDNDDPKSGTVVAAECAQINTRMRGPEKRKATVIPLLLEGTQAASLPPCLHDQVFSDFRTSKNYFETAFDLLLSLYQIKPHEPVAIELRESLGGRNTP